MNREINIREDVYWVGVNDQETSIFESLWPLPNGVSYNSYLIVDEKVALIDTVKITYHDSFIDKIKKILGNKKVDYLIVNHMEPDHSGSIKALKKEYPEIQIIGNNKTAAFLEGFYGLTDDIKIIKDAEVLKLGKHELKFHLTPMVHWPETMMTFEKSEGILFAGDAFGGFGALQGGIFDDELDIKYYEDEIRRYYTNIVAKYSPMVQKAFEKLADTDIKVIASTHGPVWRSNPDYIIDAYDRLSSYQVEEGVVVVYGSMYGNTKKIAENIARCLAENGIRQIRLYDAARTHLSYLLSDIWRFEGLIIGSCTYNTELFPPVAGLTSALLNRRVKNHKLGIFGTYSWSSAAKDSLLEFAEKAKLDLIEPVFEAKYAPAQDDLKQASQLAQNMAQALKG
ncbi:MBL fold metallo-hydrolase [Iocasia frigidifontis]|uniref:MBL fold metallo-hydrolase n=1 Tax=Iocasia fonsfrigidae TaxID=2682810 RepID=A0A8A7KJ10_9FIRM|nr:FprA family A-type flavoprotein [Iocasia fonsfrigidae]QTL98124.1 MBL fold metallo-hydrolase [Iocasia fonsfrigidae]